MKCGSGRFYCSRKGKYGFNMQGVCDARGRFLQLWIKHPAAASDFLAFIRSNFYQRLQEDGYLAAGLVILGDCAYVSTSYMVTPYKNVRAGPKDNFNFYHSQLRITIECAFGMLVHRWAILRRPLASRMGVKEQIALTVAACRLHNFCIDTSENATSNISEVEDVDELTTVRTTNAGGVELTDDGRPNQLLDGGEHFEDVTDKDIRDQEKSKVRFEMRKIVEEKGLRRVIRRSNETT